MVQKIGGRGMVVVGPVGNMACAIPSNAHTGAIYSGKLLYEFMSRVNLFCNIISGMHALYG